jgi:OOP family OmpA-OmpF porin
LPEAVRLRAGQDAQLAKALAPTIEETLRVSVQRNPRPLVDAIFPVIGPAIRRAVNESLASLSTNLNRTLDHSLSPKSVAWRMEAWRSGQRFSDVVISRTLLYRVEQVFLIDRITGLPLQHVVAPDVAAQDGAVVSSMLAAIQDFVQDSFGGPDELDQLTLGEMTVLVEQGPKAIIAAVVRGAPPPALRDLLQDLLETIHLEFGRELSLFDGDQEPLEPTRPLLETALVVQVQNPASSVSPVTLGIAALLLVLLGMWMFFAVRERGQWNDFVERLDSEPGLVVTEATRGGGLWNVRGLRDPLAVDPATLARGTDVREEDLVMRWEPYLALDSVLVVRRASDLMQPPEGVAFALGEDGRLIALGRLGDPAWREEARRQARYLPGIVGYDDSRLVDTRAERFDALVESIEAARIGFGDASDRALGTDDLAALQEQAEELARLSEELGRPLRIRVIGYASQEGTALQNERISQRRAQRVEAALVSAGIPADRIDAVGTGEPLIDALERTEADRARNRVARVVIED